MKNFNKSIYFAAILIVASLQLNAQYRYVTNADTTYLFDDDSISLNIPKDVRGEVTWQSKDGSADWQKVYSATGDEGHKIKVVATKQYRTTVKEGSCNAINSEELTVGYATDLKDLTTQGYDFNYLLNTAKIPVKDFLDDGVTVGYLLDNSLPLDSLLANNVSNDSLLANGITVQQLLDKNITITELFAAKVGVGTLLENGVDSTDLETAGLIGTDTDQDNGTFNWVKIGDQVWMSENLKVKKYRNNDPLYSSTPLDKDISAETSPHYWWVYDFNDDNIANDDSLGGIYGLLYTWYVAANPKEICPSGWHVPSSTEFETLSDYLGGSNVAGGVLKEKGIEHWNTPNTGATNASGFNALPSGYRSSGGSFDVVNVYGYLWSKSEKDATEGKWIGLDYQAVKIYFNEDDKANGYPIRCIKD